MSNSLYCFRKAVYQRYNEQKPNKREAFYESHHVEIILFEAAKNYLKENLNGHSLPFKAWKSEKAKPTAGRDAQCRGYCRLKDEVRDEETIKQTAERLICSEQESKVTRDRSAER